MVKPSELAPVAVLEFARLCHEAGVPPGVLNVVPGYGGVAGKALAEHPAVRKLDLTGGTATGAPRVPPPCPRPRPRPRHGLCSALRREDRRRCSRTEPGRCGGGAGRQGTDVGACMRVCVCM